MRSWLGGLCVSVASGWWLGLRPLSRTPLRSVVYPPVRVGDSGHHHCRTVYFSLRSVSFRSIYFDGLSSGVYMFVMLCFLVSGFHQHAPSFVSCNRFEFKSVLSGISLLSFGDHLPGLCFPFFYFQPVCAVGSQVSLL